MKEDLDMTTMIFDAADKKTPERVAVLLSAGAVGVLPCDTIYGLSGIADEKSAARIYEIKMRPASKNLITLMSLKQVSASGLIVPETVMKAWPAPLTAIVPDREGTTHAVRVPADDFIQKVLSLSAPLWSTSVNFSGEQSLVTFDDIFPVFDGLVDFIVRKEDTNASSLPSTLIDCSVSPFRLIRQGAYDASALI